MKEYIYVYMYTYGTREGERERMVPRFVERANLIATRVETII